MVYRRLAVVVIAMLMVLGATTVPVLAANSAPLTYQITGTDIGIMFRSDPGNWESRSGPAGYDGDNVKLTCTTTGAPVGIRKNRIWYQASTNSGSGYLPDAFLNTPNKANEWLPGIPQCGTSQTNSPALPKSVFFSGTDTPNGKATAAVSDKDYALKDWGTGNTCDAAKILDKIPNSVDTLAGWSRGRIGIVYFLAAATDAQRSRIHRIVLFDPGSTADIASSGVGRLRYKAACDYRFDVNKLLASWLKSDGRNQLIVIGGKDSEMKEKEGDATSRSTYAGLWQYYFAGIWNQPFADRAWVCDYNMMAHDDTIRNFAYIVKSPPQNCPAPPSGYELQAWHP